jgi:hypothetical protein
MRFCGFAVKNPICNGMKMKKERNNKNFTCEFVERHNSKLTSLLSSSS